MYLHIGGVEECWRGGINKNSIQALKILQNLYSLHKYMCGQLIRHQAHQRKPQHPQIFHFDSTLNLKYETKVNLVECTCIYNFYTLHTLVHTYLRTTKTGRMPGPTVLAQDHAAMLYSKSITSCLFGTRKILVAVQLPMEEEIKTVIDM